MWLVFNQHDSCVMLHNMWLKLCPLSLYGHFATYKATDGFAKVLCWSRCTLSLCVAV